MTRRLHSTLAILLMAAALGFATPAGAARFSEARIYIEYNSSANDLGFHVALDGEDWRSLRILNPKGASIFEVVGKGGYTNLGMTELFFEGAEPSLDDVPLGVLLALFPAGRYTFTGVTVGGARIAATATLSHAIPEGPVVSAEVEDDTVIIRWTPVTAPPAGFPDKDIDIVGYQVIVESFQVTLPATSTEVTVPSEFVESLGKGEHAFEVLAIDAGGAQTITEGTFETD
jgi:hypothetical protein